MRLIWKKIDRSVIQKIVRVLLRKEGSFYVEYSGN